MEATCLRWENPKGQWQWQRRLTHEGSLEGEGAALPLRRTNGDITKIWNASTYAKYMYLKNDRFFKININTS